MSLMKTAVSLLKTAVSLLKTTVSVKSISLKISGLIFVLTGLSFSCLSQETQEATVNLSSTIIGNREQPKVLYIVPWKAAYDSELEQQTIQSQLDIVFGHVERIELQRELQFINQIAKDAKKSEQ